MQEKFIAVLCVDIRDFEQHVRAIYESIAADKSMVIVQHTKVITIEHPAGIGSKYYPVQCKGETPISILDIIMGCVFDSIVHTMSFSLLRDSAGFYEAAKLRLKYQGVKFDTFRDGGSIGAFYNGVEYVIDYSIGTQTPGKLFFEYMGKDCPVPMEDVSKIKSELVAAAIAANVHPDIIEDIKGIVEA